MRPTPTDPDRERLGAWMEAHGARGPVTAVTRLEGGNSNATYLLQCGGQDFVFRRPPADSLSETAHSMDREFRVLAALDGTPVPVPRPVGLCSDPEVAGAPFLVMAAVDGVPLTDTLPVAYPPDSAGRLGAQMIDTLACLHSLDWGALGLADFGRPAGFLDRQVARWRSQYRSYATRDLPRFDQVADWLAAHTPVEQPPALLHGDFHLDNCLWDRATPTLRAVIDWELATIGDPLLDVGLFLAFWGERPVDDPGLARIQAVTRRPGVPSRRELVERYGEQAGRSIRAMPYYLSLSLWKLAAILEGAYAQFVAGSLLTPYARGLAHDVPRLLEEAAAHAGLGGPAGG